MNISNTLVLKIMFIVSMTAREYILVRQVGLVLQMICMGQMELKLLMN